MNPFSISDFRPRRKFKPAIPLGKIVPTPPGQACQPPAATPRNLPPLKVSTRVPHSYTRRSRSQPPYGAPVCLPVPPTPARAAPPRSSVSSQMPSSAAPRARQTPPPPRLLPLRAAGTNQSSRKGRQAQIGSALALRGAGAIKKGRPRDNAGGLGRAVSGAVQAAPSSRRRAPSGV